jgi:hypothetical protein
MTMEMSRPEPNRVERELAFLRQERSRYGADPWGGREGIGRVTHGGYCVHIDSTGGIKARKGLSLKMDATATPDRLALDWQTERLLGVRYVPHPLACARRLRYMRREER